MMACYRNIILLFGIISSHVAFGQSADSTSQVSPMEHVVNFAETVLDVMTYETETFSFAVFPAASYSGQTGLAVGVMPMLQLRKRNPERPTTITPSCLISTNKMFEVQCVADVYWGEKSSVSTKAEFFFLPDKFYGIGNQDKKGAVVDFDFHRYMLTSDLEIGTRGNVWKLGFSVDLSYHNFTAFAGDTALASEELRKAEKWSNGVGPMVCYDTRNDVVNPSNGWYVKVKSLGYLKALGSRDNYASLIFDGRYYVALSDEIVLANQLYWSGVWGDAPFHKLSTCGGTRLGRAIPHSFKYVDKFAWLVQSEVRMPVFWRIGATAFAAVGNVSHHVSKDVFDDAHFMAGAGLRFKVFPKQGLNVRFDVGFDSRGENAIYFNIREAF